METHRQLAAAQFFALRHEGQRYRVAPHRFTGCDGHAVLAAESDWSVSPRHHRRTRPLQSNEGAVKGYRLGAKRVGKAHP